MHEFAVQIVAKIFSCIKLKVLMYGGGTSAIYSLEYVWLSLYCVPEDISKDNPPRRSNGATLRVV